MEVSIDYIGTSLSPMHNSSRNYFFQGSNQVVFKNQNKQKVARYCCAQVCMKRNIRFCEYLHLDSNERNQDRVDRYSFHIEVGPITGYINTRISHVIKPFVRQKSRHVRSWSPRCNDDYTGGRYIPVIGDVLESRTITKYSFNYVPRDPLITLVKGCRFEHHPHGDNYFLS